MINIITFYPYSICKCNTEAMFILFVQKKKRRRNAEELSSFSNERYYSLPKRRRWLSSIDTSFVFFKTLAVIISENN